MSVRLAIAALVKSVFVNVQANMAEGSRRITWAYFFPIVDYPQFNLNLFQEKSQKPAHTAIPKNHYLQALLPLIDTTGH